MNVSDVTAAILTREGWPKVTNRGADRGGLSKGPITATTLAKWRSITRPIVVDDFASLGEVECRLILETWYWKDPGYEQLADDAVEALLYDFTVTSGARNAITTFQRVLGVAQDGVLGSQTVAVFHENDARSIYVALQRQRSQFVHRIALRDLDVLAFMDAHPKSQLHNLNGWNDRCLEFID